MTFGNEIIFLMTSLIVLGMTVHAASLYEGAHQARPSRALMATFVLANLGALSAMLFVWLSPVFLSLANTLVLASVGCGALTVRSWRTPLSRPVLALSVGLLILVLLVFELMRLHSSYVYRVVFFTSVSLLVMVWLLLEAWPTHQKEKSFQLKFLMAVVLGSLLLRLGRMVLVLTQTVQPETLFDEAGATAILRIAALAMDILFLSSLLGYSTHILALRHQQMQRDNEQVRLANAALDMALAEKNQMLKALTLSVKSNHMGVLLASTMHELSQPLQALQLRAELLAGLPDVSAQQRQELLQALLKDSQRSVDIMVQLRKFLRHGTAEPRCLRVSDLALEAVALMQTEWDAHQIELDVQVPPALCVWADESQLQMVVLNLLKNALDVLRGCPLPRKLSLQLVQEQQDVCLRVSDNGPGIALAQRQQVFQIFHSSKADGMGLGLWLSQSVAQNHGGSLSVVDSPLGGACFMLRLPVFVAN